MFTENLGAFFTDFGVTATYGGNSAQVIFRTAENVIGDVISADYIITYPTGSFATLTQGNSIVVDGVTYTVNFVQRMADGKLTQASLSKP